MSLITSPLSSVALTSRKFLHWHDTGRQVDAPDGLAKSCAIHRRRPLVDHAPAPPMSTALTPSGLYVDEGAYRLTAGVDTRRGARWCCNRRASLPAPVISVAVEVGSDFTSFTTLDCLLRRRILRADLRIRDGGNCHGSPEDECEHDHSCSMQITAP